MISCLCATYGRVKLLEEAIESFHRQDYTGEKELIVLNTRPEQELHYEHPEVCVVNLPRRIADLGDIRNTMVAMARGDIIAMWDDDDIHLPWRLSTGTAMLENCDYYRPWGSWCWPKKAVLPMMLFGLPGISIFHAQSLYTRRCFKAVGGYRTNCRLLDDRIFDQDVMRLGVKAELGVQAMSRYAYLYRTGWSWNWSDGESYDLDAGHPLNEEKIQVGRIDLAPRWDYDYAALIKQQRSACRISDPYKALKDEKVSRVFWEAAA